MVQQCLISTMMQREGVRSVKVQARHKAMQGKASGTRGRGDAAVVKGWGTMVAVVVEDPEGLPTEGWCKPSPSPSSRGEGLFGGTNLFLRFLNPKKNIYVKYGYVEYSKNPPFGTISVVQI